MQFWKNFFENLGQNYLTDAGFSRIMMERFSRALTYGGIAQLARAFGSYPKCHRFKSSYRYQRYKVSLKYPGSAAIVTDKLLAVLAKSCILIRPVGQAVKTRPFHGCNMGSIPVRVTKTKHRNSAHCWVSVLFFLPVHTPCKKRSPQLSAGSEIVIIHLGQAQSRRHGLS